MESTRSIYDGQAEVFLPIALAVLAAVAILTAVALVLGRRRGDSVRPSSDRAENLPLEGAYIALLAALVVVLVAVTFRHEARSDAATSRSGLRVDVTAAKWRWRFAYAGTGVALEDRLVVPAGREVRFRAHSLDVLHDFWVPDRRFQRQVWPDRFTTFSLTFPPGSYDGVCAWFCGLRHKDMRFVVQALPPARFRAWLAARRAAA